MHSWSSTPCLARSSCTLGHPHLVLHGPCAHLVTHTLPCTFLMHIWSPNPCSACSSCTPLHAPCHSSSSTPCSAQSSCRPAHPHLALHIPQAHLVIHTLPCTLLVHICSSTPCSACSSCTPAFLCMLRVIPHRPHLALRIPHAHLVPLLALHAPCAHLLIHTLLCMILVRSLSSTPCFAHFWCAPALALHAPCAFLVTHALLCTLPVHSCPALLTRDACHALHSPRAGHCPSLTTAPVPGCLQHRGAVFWRKPQDDPPVRLLPSLCPVHPLLQGEVGPGGDTRSVGHTMVGES